MQEIIVGGVVVFREREAIEIAKKIDGSVDYILVDAEKKIPHNDADVGAIPNIERRVREQVKKSNLSAFKGNDISVDAVDSLVGRIFNGKLKGIGGKKIAIIGGGNLGAKLALKFVERGADVFLTRRDTGKLEKIVDGINLIKSANTLAQVVAVKDNKIAAYRADVLIGSTTGVEVISRDMVKDLNSDPIIIDVGKGTLYPDALEYCSRRGIVVYRLDVTAALFGLIHTLLTTDRIVSTQMGRRTIGDFSIVSGGLLARSGEIVVDNFNEPRRYFGIADGRGDLQKNVAEEKISAIKKQLSIGGDSVVR